MCTSRLIDITVLVELLPDQDENLCLLKSMLYKFSKSS